MAEKKQSPAGSSFWQIIFPTLVGTILFLLICIWLVFGTEIGNITRFAELSTIFLVIPVLFFSLINLIILGGLVYLVAQLILKVPPITSQILDFLNRVRDGVKKFSEMIVKPVIQPASLLGGFRSIISREKSRVQIDDGSPQ